MTDSQANQGERYGSQVEDSRRAAGPARKGDPKREILSAEQLRAWGHLASVAVLVLALFAFGLRIMPAGSQTGSPDGKQGAETTKETHLHVHWEEVPAILIVFILAELGVELVAAAQMVRDRVEKANEAVGSLQEASEKLKEASESSARALEDRLNGVTATFDESARTLKEAVSGFKGSADLLRDATILSHQTGDEDVWPALARFVSYWNVDVRHTDGRSRPLVGNLFQAFIGASSSPASVRNGETSITCVTVDSIYAELSRLFLEGAAQRGEAFVVWAVSSLHPFEFCCPRVFWSRDDYGPGQRVSSLEKFVHTVMDQCLNNKALAQYRRLTLFTSQSDSGYPTLKVRPTAEVESALDSWFVWNADHADHDLRDKLRAYGVLNMFEWLREHCGQAVPGVLPPQEFEEFVAKEARRSTEQVHFLPTPDDPVKVHRYQVDADTGIAFLPASALQVDATHAADALQQLYTTLDVASPPVVTTMTAALRTAGWLSVREWYCTKMHKGKEIRDVARFAVIKENTHGMNAFRIELDGREWETVDLILMGTPPKHDQDQPQWIAGLLSDIDFDSPACIVKLVLDQDELRQLGNAVTELWLSSNTDGGCWDKSVKPPADA